MRPTPRPAHLRRSRREARIAAAIAGGALAFGALASGAARAAENDGAYGRFDGDIDVALGAGAAIVDGGAALAAGASAMYFETAGFYFGYTDALGQGALAVTRSLAGGVALRPLFIGRYANDLERGPAHLDLTLDSFELDLGAFWAQPKGESFAATPGLELGVRLEAPILPRASGPFIWVRGALRWRPADLASDHEHASLAERGALIAFGLAWHQVVLAHLIDAGDRLER